MFGRGGYINRGIVFVQYKGGVIVYNNQMKRRQVNPLLLGQQSINAHETLLFTRRPGPTEPGDG